MGILEQLINTKSINFIIGGTLIVLAIIALVWMYSWFKKSKEYKKILKSIDDKVEACNNEELGKELKALAGRNDKTEDSSVTVKGNDVAEDPKEAKSAKKVTAEQSTAHSFNRAMAAIETLEKDETEQQNVQKEKIDVAKEAKAKAEKEKEAKLKAEKLALEKEVQAKAAELKAEKERIAAEKADAAEKLKAATEEAEKIKSEVAKVALGTETTDDLPEVEVKTVEIPQDDDDDDECAVDVFAEIRKMLVETEKNPTKTVPEQKEEIENIAKSGKEYTREELENLIKF